MIEVNERANKVGIMFKISKIVLFSLITCICLLLIASGIKQYDNESVPQMNSVITVTSDKQKVSKATIFNSLSRISKKNHIQLMLVRMKNVNGKITKTFYNFNPDTKPVASFYKNQNKISNQAVQLEDIKGAYYTDAQDKKLEKLTDEFNKLGLTYSSYHTSFFNSVQNNIENDGFIPIFASILGILLIVIFIEKISTLKKFAILKLNGWSFKQIFARELSSLAIPLSVCLVLIEGIFVIYCLLQMNSSGVLLALKASLITLLGFIVIFIFLELISYSCVKYADVYSAIKGQTSSTFLSLIGYLFKSILILIVTVNVFALQNSITTLHEDQRIMQMWISKHSGYVLGFTNINPEDKKQERFLGKTVKKLIKANPDVIISKNNQEFYPAVESLLPENGNVLTVNKNYLKYNKFYRGNGQVVKANNLAKHKLNILIPYARKHQNHAFYQELASFLKFQNELDNKKTKNLQMKDLNFISVKDDYQVFNYTLGKEIKDSISKIPIIVIDDNRLSNNFYWSAASQGMVQFSNLKQLEQEIKALGLNNYVTSITDAQNRLSNFYIQILRNIAVLSAIVVLSFIQLIFIIVFLSLMFLQKQRKRIAITKIFGKSVGKIIYKFMAINLGIDFGIIVFCLLFLNVDVSVVLYMLAYLIVEIGVIAFLAIYSQKDILTTLNHGN